MEVIGVYYYVKVNCCDKLTNPFDRGSPTITTCTTQICRENETVNLTKETNTSRYATQLALRSVAKERLGGPEDPNSKRFTYDIYCSEYCLSMNLVFLLLYLSKWPYGHFIFEDDTEHANSPSKHPGCWQFHALIEFLKIYNEFRDMDSLTSGLVLLFTANSKLCGASLVPTRYAIFR